jgi:hypothetical protein
MFLSEKRHNKGRVMRDTEPKFFNSPYFVGERWRSSSTWKLKDGAPAEIKEEFDEYIEDTKPSKEPKER